MQEKNTEISARLAEVIEQQGYNANSFAKALGYPRSQAIYDMLSGKSAPSYDFFNKFLNSEISEKVNLEWLITGRGTILKSSHMVQEPQVQYTSSKSGRIREKQSIPLYDVQAAAGLVTLFRDHEHANPIDHMVIPNLPACDGAVYVTGDSMYPLLKSGDIIAYKQVNDIKNNIWWGEMYLLAYEYKGDSYVVVKYIKKSDIPDHVKLVSYNQNHSDKDIPLEAIKALAIIKASVRLNSMA